VLFVACCGQAAAQVLPVEGEGSFTSSSTDVIDGTAQLLQPGFGAGGQQDEQRWVPYRHTNGVAIYHHKESAATCSLCSCGQVRRRPTPVDSRQLASSTDKVATLAAGQDVGVALSGM
jgi:hypothetical protein